ncbi:uroplakin-1b-like [Erpetoichthys calabaricus]|uniref:Uroplakin-1b n=1 Tax=Erpetoichthys calabaricus TaxID=27687 RepID=A0A8C4X328_ERPCA|nr:uroplakin-1b-like [Erpetoichthys calabaricus]
MPGKGDPAVRCFQIALILGNVVIACSGIALSAECIFFLSDQNGYYVLLYATGRDTIFAAAWIGLFTGFAFFCTSILGIYSIMKSKRKLLLAYILLMLFIWCFEVASSISAITQRDWFVPNLFLQQMLQIYQAPLPTYIPSTQDQIYIINGITNSWNNVMTTYQCCGVNGPQDWISYNSTFRAYNSDSQFPWPRQCCSQAGDGTIVDVNACIIGIPNYVYTQGCFDFIAGPLNRHAWGVAWFGFAILCWTFFVIAGAMFFYTQLEA